MAEALRNRISPLRGPSVEEAVCRGLPCAADTQPDTQPDTQRDMPVLPSCRGGRPAVSSRRPASHRRRVESSLAHAVTLRQVTPAAARRLGARRGGQAQGQCRGPLPSAVAQTRARRATRRRGRPAPDAEGLSAGLDVDVDATATATARRRERRAARRSNRGSGRRVRAGPASGAGPRRPTGKRCQQACHATPKSKPKPKR